jgi:hypothetical protein
LEEGRILAISDKTFSANMKWRRENCYQVDLVVKKESEVIIKALAKNRKVTVNKLLKILLDEEIKRVGRLGWRLSYII